LYIEKFALFDQICFVVTILHRVIKRFQPVMYCVESFGHISRVIPLVDLYLIFTYHVYNTY